MHLEEVAKWLQILQDEHRALQNSADLIEARVDAAAVLEMLGSGYNTDLMEGQLGAFWTWMCLASESLSSWVPPSAARSPPDGVEGPRSGNSFNRLCIAGYGTLINESGTKFRADLIIHCPLFFWLLLVLSHV
jgi:hypothetical protein